MKRKSLLANASAPNLLWAYLDQALQERPNQVALVHSQGKFTYAELHRDAEALALGLHHLGARAGDTISYQMPNWSETVLIVLAAMRLGAICNPIITIYRAKETAFILSDAGARFVFVPKSYRKFDHAALMAPLARDANAQMIVCRGRFGDALTYEDVLATGRRLQAEGQATSLPSVDPQSDVLYLYTSGTEGMPKGVRHTHATIMNEAHSVIEATRLGPADTLFMGSPLTHITGFSYACVVGFVIQSKVCLLDVWNIDDAADLIEREACVWTVGATPFLQGLIEDPAIVHKIRSLRIFRCGGADVPPHLIRQANIIGIRAMRTYGCSEHPTISGGVDDDPAKAATTDGRVHRRNRVRIVDLENDDLILCAGEVGEIQSMGPELFAGYVNSDLDTRAFTPDGWFRTGDLGRLDADGYLTVVGRRKDIIIRKGENISAKEVEDLIMELQQVSQCAVIGVPDADRGEMMVAVCVLAPTATLDISTLTHHLEHSGIARQKFPERLEIIDEMPMNAAGKIRKVDLRARFSVSSSTTKT
ncbi:AMP-binding protein [Pontitalea aquivivens]|uniref:AMP-binding protein n=1 Tax=Pontitalea aquivivens TaxID=3388663 RepID=UPI0039710E85